MYDKKNLKNKNVGRLIEAARGKRSLRQYAKDAGVSYATIYAIESGKNNPEPETIKKLTSKQAKPENDVTFDDVMIAAGYRTEDFEEKVNAEAHELAEKIVEDRLSNSGEQLAVEPMPDYRGAILESRMEYAKIENKAKGIIYNAIDQLNVSFTKKADDEHRSGPMVPDLILSIDKGRINEWWIEFKMARMYTHGNTMSIYAAISRLLALDIRKNVKLSIVTNDVWAFNSLKRYDHQMSIRAEFSIILVDMNNGDEISEVYLSNYDLDDRSAEFYLT
ncbi:MAG: helix-turn-helix transcriptional regulator [Butyrivibrio sp.]|nr:helix-turn-helix transcriptional regulator [Butyrivibrio sp.]